MQKHLGFRIFVALIVIAVLTIIVTGIFISGSPGRARRQQLDQNRVNDLTNIQYAINNFWDRAHHLPQNLNELQSPNPYTSITDPKTKQPYEYKVIGDAKYQLCATFGEEGLRGLNQSFGKHAAGHQCFDLEVPLPPPPEYLMAPQSGISDGAVKN